MSVLPYAKAPRENDNQSSKVSDEAQPVYKRLTQPGLFGEFPFSRLGRMDQDDEIRQALVLDIRDYCRRNPGHSRAHVAGLIQDLIGEPFSEDILNAYTATSRRNYQFPARKIAAWCVAMNSSRLLDLILKSLGRRLATLEEEKLSELGMIDSQIEELQKRRNQLLQK